jgi:hypothetical protein
MIFQSQRAREEHTFGIFFVLGISQLVYLFWLPAGGMMIAK